MKIVLFGANGRMGRMIQSLVEKRDDFDIIAKVDNTFTDNEKMCEYSFLRSVKNKADCLVDFSHHETVKDVIDFCLDKNMPAVIATTAHTEAEKKIIEEASKKIPIFYSFNMSMGIAFLCETAKRAASMFPDADIEIVETHHNKKKDVPSGTALMIYDNIKQSRANCEAVIGRSENGERKKTEIGIHSLRLGSEAGKHEVLISNGDETICISHKAESRMLFAQGALRAANFIRQQKNGLYSLMDLVK